MRKLAIIAVLALLSPALCQAATLEELLVEKGVITQSEARGTMSDGAKAYYKDGTRLEFPDAGFTTKINTIIQTRYSFIDGDSDVGIPNANSFDVRTARIKVSGTALNKEFKYVLQADMVGAYDQNYRSSPDLLDAYIDWEPCEGAGVRLGQFKTALGRGYNTEIGNLQFPDRSQVTATFTTGRQAGTRAYYNAEDDAFSVFASAYNGESDGEGGLGPQGRNFSGVDTNLMGDIGVRGNLMGQMDPFVEGDVDMTEDAALNGGVTYSYSDANNDVGGGLDKTSVSRIAADLNFKLNGLSIYGEFFYADYSNDAVSTDTKPTGAYAAAGYMFTPEFELAARYGFVDCDKGTPFGACSVANGVVDDLNEIDVSLNYYFWKHALKAQLAWSFLDQDLIAAADPVLGTKDVQTNRWMFQLTAAL